MDLLRTGREIAISLAVAALPAGASVSEAQLISPGKLAAPHASLEGIRQCTQCHQLRHKGPSTDKCLACHTPLGALIEAGKGLHATYDVGTCATCHRDHLGTDYSMVVFDTATFVHDSAGYALKQSHAEAGCRDCHTADHVTAATVRQFKSGNGDLNTTFLGLTPDCQACHGNEDPHQKQFPGQTCDQCHDESVWKEAPRFDHDDAEYRLTGEHRTVTCETCHPVRSNKGGTTTMIFGGLAFGRCNDCHQDPHQGGMTGGCPKCHSTRGWSRINQTTFEGGFDHSATNFALRGAHADAACSSCHSTRGNQREGLRVTFARGSAGRRYPKPVVTDCTSCHTDYHEAEFQGITGGPVCSNCHGEAGWLPTSFGLSRHGQETAFPITGRHILVACSACHVGPSHSFQLEAATCAACHGDDDPHANQFPGSDCADCHTADGFTSPTVDHQATRFPLDGAHQTVPCASCHPVEQIDGRAVRRFTPLGTACKDCHG